MKATLLTLCIALAGCSVFDPIEPPYIQKGPVYLNTKEGGSIAVYYNYPEHFHRFCQENAYACAVVYLNDDGSVNTDYPCYIMLRANHQSDTIQRHEERHCTDGNWPTHDGGY